MKKTKKNKLKSTLNDNSIKDSGAIFSTIPIKSTGIFSFQSNRKNRDTATNKQDSKKKTESNRDIFDHRLMEGIAQTEPTYQHPKYHKNTTENICFTHKIKKARDIGSPVSKRIKAVESNEKLQLKSSNRTQLEKSSNLKIEKNPLKSSVYRDTNSLAMQRKESNPDQIYIRDGNENSDMSPINYRNTSLVEERSPYDRGSYLSNNKERLNVSCENIIFAPGGVTSFIPSIPTFGTNILLKENANLNMRETSLNKNIILESSVNSINQLRNVQTIRPSSKINILTNPNNVKLHSSNNPSRLITAKNASNENSQLNGSINYSSSQPNVVFNNTYHNDSRGSTVSVTKKRVIRNSYVNNNIERISVRNSDGEANKMPFVKNSASPIKIVETIGYDIKTTSARPSIKRHVINPASPIKTVETIGYDIKTTSARPSIKRHVINPAINRNVSSEVRVAERIKERTKSYRHDKSSSPKVGIIGKEPQIIQREFNDVQGLKDEINR